MSTPLTPLQALPGVKLIAVERAEQIQKHGWSLKQDAVTKNHYQLSQAASLLCWVDPEDVGGVCVSTGPKGDVYDFSHCCPSDWDELVFNKMMNKPYDHRIKVAGALLAAELDRINELWMDEIESTPSPEPVNTKLLNALKGSNYALKELAERTNFSKAWLGHEEEVTGIISNSESAIASAEQPDEPITVDALEREFLPTVGAKRGSSYTVTICPKVYLEIFFSSEGWKLALSVNGVKAPLPNLYTTMSQIVQLIAALTIGVEKGAGA